MSMSVWSNESYERYRDEKAKVKRLRESLEAVIVAYEQAGYILGKQPESITKVLTDARKVLEETR